MRKITEDAVSALLNFDSFKRGNTQVEQCVIGNILYLHGNAIAYWTGINLYISDAGCPTATTRDRLAGAVSMVGKGHVNIKQGETILTRVDGTTAVLKIGWTKV